MLSGYPDIANLKVQVKVKVEKKRPRQGFS
jgi:hypothetical protein